MECCWGEVLIPVWWSYVSARTALACPRGVVHSLRRSSVVGLLSFPLANVRLLLHMKCHLRDLKPL